MIRPVARTQDGQVDPTDPLAIRLSSLASDVRAMPPTAEDRRSEHVALILSLAEARWWEAWVTMIAPDYVAGMDGFSQYQRDFWNWFSCIGQERPRPMVACWPRGGGKTTTVQLCLLWAACTSLRAYGIYVALGGSEAAKRISDVGELLLSDPVAEVYPDVSVPYRTRDGQKRDWSTSRIRTGSGFTLDAFGMDQGMRGAKVEDQRPGIIIFDDIEQYHDSPYLTQKRIEVITHTIIPAAAPNAIFIHIQNKIHDDSIMARYIDGRADWFGDRIVLGPIQQIDGLVTEEERSPEGFISHVIVAGEPTWPQVLGLAVSEHQLVEEGLPAFLSEKQHHTDVGEGDMFPRVNWATINADDVPLKDLRLCRAWDLAVTEGGGDWTVGVLMGMTEQSDRIYILDVVRGQWGVSGVEQTIVDTAAADRQRYGRVKIAIEAQVGTAKAWNERYEKELLVEYGVKLVPAQGNKTFRADGLASVQQRGGATIVVADWNSVFVREHVQFPDLGRHDDIVDADALAFNTLARGRKSRGGVRAPTGQI